ncbi:MULTISPECIES: recombinase family protein [Enterobacter]|jgi:DNA invertase Pin-like site-specific DNA recombinase|uniref:Resolvase n=1 Tax=Enterobacter kobei TaxID=208224 RepID=A0ABX9F0N2_9ENTR|nr:MULTISPECIES: recombinase family protein [Enterobacter]CAE7618992.1 Putative transposon Tn552 DNA-invertase bin3 [Enterobacter cloacae]EKM5741166.1 recombinase family protein [Enterobacter kobei]EKS6750172.1 recombinase family protein [Enterobacter kobei]EKV5792396.1 recombinase family protein [Enterobacter kobei]ELE6992177.1 recombinase family protein [Enterobacter kobei]
MTTSRVYAYLRASTKEQDATRAKAVLAEFAAAHNLGHVTYFTENVSGASLQRPELMRLIDIAAPGDILLVEQVDRLSRLNAEDWETLKAQIDNKGLRVVALDLPTSHVVLAAQGEFMQSMMKAINGMMLEMLTAIARKDYTDRRRRQAEGISKAKAGGAYKGRPVNDKLHEQIRAWHEAGKTKSEIHRLTGAARTTINKVLEA